jgi:hypothetical protein
MTDPSTTALAEAITAALVGQECTFVRDSVGGQLVIGFGTPALADWPLRATLRAPWLLYSRYGAWDVADGVHDVADHAETLTEDVLQQVRAVLLGQRVSAVEFDASCGPLSLTFGNGASVRLQQSGDLEPDEEAWSLHAPRSLIEWRAGDVHVVPRRVEQLVAKQSEVAAIHELLRGVADRIGLYLLEPKPTAAAGFDAVLSAPDGTVLLVQVKSRSDGRGLAISAVTIRKDTTPPTVTELSATGVTVDELTAEVQRMVNVTAA